METELLPLNNYRLAENGDRKAVIVVIEVPEGCCWEDIGHKALMAGLDCCRDREPAQ